MSKSLAKKRSDKKRKGDRVGKVRTSDYSRSRQAQPPFPDHDRKPTTMLIRNRVVSLVRIENSDGWQQGVSRGDPMDHCELRAHLSDGTIVVRKVAVVYGLGEREKVFEPMLRGDMTPQEASALTRLVLRRCKALQDGYGSLQREFGMRVCG